MIQYHKIPLEKLCYFAGLLDVEAIGKTLGLDVVPIIGTGTLKDMVAMTKSGFKSRWNDDLIAEGIVARPETEMRRRNGDRIITKLKYKDFFPSGK